MTTAYPWGTHLSYSLLKKIDPDTGSPAEFRHACAAPFEPTREMRIGTCAHWHLLGGPEHRRPLVYEGDKVRDPKAWKAYKAEHAGERIYGLDEWREGEAIGCAVRTAPHNRPIYTRWIEGGQYETPLEWEMGGFPFHTGGVDILRPGVRELVDYKTAATVRRGLLSAQVSRLRYPEQLVTYAAGVRACLWEPRVLALVATCSSPPYCSVALVMGGAACQAADAHVASWLDLLRRCLDTDTWPGPEGWEIEPPAWERMQGEEDLPEAAG